MFFRYNLFNILWALCLLLLTLMPGKDMPDLDLWWLIGFDKAAHFFFFSVLMVLTIIGFRKQYQFISLRTHAERGALLACVGFGASIEVIQSMIPGRSVEYEDIIANILGCLLGYGIYYLIYKL